MNSYWIDVMLGGGINAVLAWSLGVIVRSGQLSVGHAALAGVGGYVAAYLALHGASTLLTFVAAFFAAGAVGLILSTLTLRLNHLFLALATLIFGQIIVIVVGNTDTFGGAAGLAGIPLIPVGRITVGILVVIVLVELLILRGSRFELLTRVFAHDPDLVAMSGVSPRLLQIGCFTVSAAAAGIGGTLTMYHASVIQPVDLSFDRSLFILVYVMVGGAASGLGSLAGGFVLTVLPNVLGLEGVSASLLLGAVLLAVMLLRSEGLIPRLPLRLTTKDSRTSERGHFIRRTSHRT